MTYSLSSVNYNIISKVWLHRNDDQTVIQTAINYLYCICKYRHKCMNDLLHAVHTPLYNLRINNDNDLIRFGLLREECVLKITSLEKVINDRTNTNRPMKYYSKQLLKAKHSLEIIDTTINELNEKIREYNELTVLREHLTQVKMTNLWKLIPHDRRITRNQLAVIIAYLVEKSDHTTVLLDFVHTMTAKKLNKSYTDHVSDIQLKDKNHQIKTFTDINEAASIISTMPNAHVTYRNGDKIKIMVDIDYGKHHTLDYMIEKIKTCLKDHMILPYLILDDYSVSKNEDYEGKYHVVFNKIHVKTCDQAEIFKSLDFADNRIYSMGMNYLRVPGCKKMFDGNHVILKGELKDFIDVHKVEVSL